MTLVGAIAMGTGVMIGAGIFALTGQVAELVGELSLFSQLQHLIGCYLRLSQIGNVVPVEHDLGTPNLETRSKIMNILPIDKKILDRFGPYTLITGLLLIVLGTLGIVLPGVMSLSTAIFVGWLLLIGGIFWAIHTYQYSPKNVMDWLKPVLMFIIGSLLLFYPVKGVEVEVLLLAIYLLLHAFGSFTLAQSIYPTGGWGWMTFNGVVSALLASLFLIGWPATSLWLVGLYVGISLLFDGWALVAIGWMLRKGK